MSFHSAVSNSKSEIRARVARGINVLRYGISYLDDALKGILTSDLILIGAPSGVGKTALCSNIALKNIEDGKTVHYFALEAEQFEIESRMKYQLIAGLFFADKNRPDIQLSFDDWYLGHHIDVLEKYEKLASEMFETAFKKLFFFYKHGEFGIADFIERTIEAAENTDLIIVDHVHYFDLDDDNENRAIKKIASTARTLALENNKPIILVAHLRKKDRFRGDLVPDMDEFHGSSDLYKIASRVITFSGGARTESGNYETFFRIPKNRINGSVTRFLGRMVFNPKKGCYEEEYKIGNAQIQRGDDFTEIESSLRPDWAARGIHGDRNHTTSREPTILGHSARSSNNGESKKGHWWD